MTANKFFEFCESSWYGRTLFWFLVVTTIVSLLMGLLLMKVWEWIVGWTTDEA